MRRDFNMFRHVFSRRGQTAPDYLVGMTIFLVTLGIVFAFVPGMFQPFDTSTGGNMLVAERSASLLAGNLLVANVTAPGVLDERCTAEFFDGDGSVGTCRFDHDGSALNVALGVDDATNLNVTIRSGGSTLSIDDGGTPVSAAVGRAPPPTASVVVGKRAVVIGHRQAILAVRVW